MNYETVEFTVTSEGLAAFVKDLLSLLKKKRTVEKVAPETGKYYMVTEDIPESELFTVVEIRNGDDGKFVVRANKLDLDRLNKRAIQDAQVLQYQSL